MPTALAEPRRGCLVTELAALDHGNLHPEDAGTQAPLGGVEDGPQIPDHRRYSARQATVLRGSAPAPASYFPRSSTPSPASSWTNPLASPGRHPGQTPSTTAPKVVRQ